ncbi:MAG: alanine--tRNA ligase, partial [Actinomycetota bacterium]
MRKTFLDYFAQRGHEVVPSSSLVPDDPSLLLTTAGMVQFKPFFLGEAAPPYRRAASVQKCFRTTDLEIVGKTKRHLTFFEMLGNFSFGDYFKPEAITWAWELMTDRYGLDPNRLWATVFETDDEAAEIWKRDVGLPPERIVRLGRENNFWDMGVAGPCGPNSELLYDRGDAFGKAYEGGSEIDEERYLEVYNLVFMQFVQNDALEIVGDLPMRGVDTGLGLERLASVLQDVPTVFETDTLNAVLQRASEVLGRGYGEDPEIDVSLRVLAEHGRGITFLIADGVFPSNEQRGYVLRRLIRRAVRYARLAGVDHPVLPPLIETTIEVFGEAYPEVSKNRELIRRVVEREEERFDATLRQGLAWLEEEVAAVRRRGGATLPGRTAFRLHDTYGFPLDLTHDIAAEEGLSVDLQEFEELMTGQRDRARAARRAEKGAEPELERSLTGVEATEFVGYERLEDEATVIGLLGGSEGRMSSTPVLEEDAEGQVVLNQTPFYAESGGQVGDTGEVVTETGIFRVEDTSWGVPGVIVHAGRVVSGEIRVGQAARASVDRGHREGVRQSHTATHILHWGLRDHLGEHATQKGSLVEPGRLRFDFSHYEHLQAEQLGELEEELNRRVLFDDAVRAFETSYDYAMSLGAIALFGEKYGEYVRVVEVGEYSRELCGGTHVAHTGQVGIIKLLGESSVGAGTRRVEAYTGLQGLRHMNSQAERLAQAASLLKVDEERVVERLERLLESVKEMESQISERRSRSQAEEVDRILAEVPAKIVGSARFLMNRRDGTEVGDLRKLAVSLGRKLGSSLVVLGSARDSSANLVAAASPDLVSRGVSAQEVLSQGAALLGGR